MQLRSEPATIRPSVSKQWQPVAVRWHCGQVALITILFFVYGGAPAPDVNEAHYLGKAKHFWDPTFCANDFFYSSRDAHTVFFYAFGWLTRYVSLPTAAWLGRWIGWTLLATSWHLLSHTLIPVRAASLLTASAWIVLIQQTQMSGEWIIGGIEAKVLAYALVIFALREFILQRWTTAWILLGSAAAFHVLVGGWAVVLAAFGCASLPKHERPPWQHHLLGCFVGGLISLLGLLPALRLNAGVAPDVAQQAAQIYVYDRLPHHLLLRAFPSELVARHMSITAVFLILLRTLRHRPLLRRLFGFCAGATFLLIIGAGFDAAFGDQRDGASVLRFYWFRCSDIFIPVAVSLGAVYWFWQRSQTFPRSTKFAVAIAILLLSINAADVVSMAHRRPVPAADYQGGIRWTGRLKHWKNACQWIQDNLPEDATFLTPSNHQTFKWYAARAELVTWKDVPQDAQGLLEWSDRLDAVQAWRNSPNPRIASQRLKTIRDRYPFDFVVTGWPSIRLTQDMVPIYRNSFYAVHTFTEDVPIMGDSSRTRIGNEDQLD